MRKIRRVIGLNTGHNGGCALCVDGKIVVAISEERLTRRKNTKGWLNSLNYCLETAGFKLSDIDLIVFSSYRDRLPKNYDGGLSNFRFSENKCISIDHHLSHACSVFLTSPFKESLIFIYDGHGNDNDTESFYIGKGTDIKKIGGNPISDPKRGIVRAYESFTSYFGWEASEAGKTMGLSSYGNVKKYSKFPIYEEDKKKGWFFNKLEEYYTEGVEILCKKYDLKAPLKFSKTPFPDYVDMAAWIQTEFERAIIGTVKKMQRFSRSKNLCLAGGGALNSVCNKKILEQTNIKNLFIFPAASDAGQCVGNALFGYYTYGKHKRKKDFIWKTDYTGKIYDEKDTEMRLFTKRGFRANSIAKAPNYKYKRVKNITKKTAKLIAEGKIVGWFQGGSELGPRALGHRSILCDPRGKEMKNILNDRVKHRESFRPFAASVKLGEISNFFELDTPSPFMLLVAKVKKNKRKLIPAVTHIDGTCRIQTVTRWENGSYFDLINEFHKITGIPLILNTSFNLAGEPIVETPTDAMKCFLKTEMDYLVIDNFLIEKVK